eukprot:UN10089
MMTTLPDTDDNKNSASDEKEGIDVSQFESKLQFEDVNHVNDTNPPSIRHKKRKNSKRLNDINAILKQIPMKKEKEKEPLPSLTRICLEIMYRNLTQYESFDFLPEDIAAELLMMVVDRQAFTRDIARPFLNTKHQLIKQFCNKHIRLSRLPTQYTYGCKGFDR